MKKTKEYYANSNIYNVYKPLRNKIREFELDDCLYVLWNYRNHVSNRNTPFTDMEVPVDFLELDMIQKHRIIAPWFLETLTREIILNSPKKRGKPKTLRNWLQFSNIVNKLKDVEGKISKDYIRLGNVLYEMHRISHHQFPWQSKIPSMQYFTRYSIIFSDPGLSRLVNDSIGVSIQDFYLIAVALWGYFLEKIGLDFPPILEIPEITQDKLEKFLQHFSCDLDTYREKTLNELQMNERFNYYPRTGRIYPLLHMNYYGKQSLVCPDSTLLFWRVTDGLYYEINKLAGFSDSFGPAFQNYVGKVLEKVCINNSYFAEQRYGSRREQRDSVDWIIDGGGCAVFVECKTKRMTEEAKVELFDTRKIDEDLEKMADFIVQTYDNIREYRQNKYVYFSYNPDKKIYPMVLTLENWHVFGGYLHPKLKEAVTRKMLSARLPVQWIDEMPYSVCAIEEFERFIKIAEQVGLCTVMNQKFSGEKKEWLFDLFLQRDFPIEWANWTFLFDEEFNALMPARFSDNEE